MFTKTHGQKLVKKQIDYNATHSLSKIYHLFQQQYKKKKTIHATRTQSLPQPWKHPNLEQFRLCSKTNHPLTTSLTLLENNTTLKLHELNQKFDLAQEHFLQEPQLKNALREKTFLQYLIHETTTVKIIQTHMINQRLHHDQNGPFQNNVCYWIIIICNI